MRSSNQPKLFVTFIVIIFILLIVIYKDSDEDRQRHSNSITLVHENEEDSPKKAKTEKSQSDKLSVLDPVSMQLQNISDLSSNVTNKVKIIQEQSVQAEEKQNSFSVFFILLILVLAILIVHALLITEFHYIPESLAIVLLGAFVGFILSYSRYDFREVESFNPNFFFLVLLPPIIFESGWNLNKQNFFSNAAPIFSFAILGTIITGLVMTIGIYLLGSIGILYSLTITESFVYGSLLSAIDPVITLAIFQTLKVNPQLYIMTFGESVLNDVIAIVMFSTAIDINSLEIKNLSTFGILRYGIYRFLTMFFVSALIGIAIGIISSLLYKHIYFRKTPELEMSLLLIFAYLPYGLAEALSLSGIMAILFCSITMSQYTKFNLTPVTQLTMQTSFRTLSFVAETCTFAYLGLAFFSIKLVFQPAFLFWSIVLIFVSRAANIFPVTHILNKYMRNKIAFKNQVIMWLCGSRGAVAFALALHMDVQNIQNKQMLLSSTLFVVLFSIVFMGPMAFPLIKFLDKLFPNETNEDASIAFNQSKRKILLSKTQEMNQLENFELIDADHDHEQLTTQVNQPKSVFSKLNESFIRPFLVRNLSKEEVREDQLRLRQMTEALCAEYMDRHEESRSYLPTSSPLA